MAATGRTRGGKKRELTNLQIRRSLWDGQSNKDGTKRPGSNKK